MNNRFFLKGLAITIVLIAVSVSVNAQWFAGGEVGLNIRSENSEVTSFHKRLNVITIGDTQIYKKTNLDFKIAPKGGYYFNEKFALGLSFFIGGTFVSDDSDKDNKFREYYVPWGVYPFARYSVFTYKKFSILLEGYTGVGCTHSFWKIRDNKIGKVGTSLGINVFNITPVVSFKLTERFQMETGLHFLSVGYNINIATIDATAFLTQYPREWSVDSYKTNYVKHNFDIGFNSGNVFSLSQLTIGVLYKF